MTGVVAVNRGRTIRRVSFAVYFAGLAVLVAVRGVPEGRLQLMSIIVLGLCIAAIGSGPTGLRRVLVDWLPFTLLLMAYDLSRHLATAVSLPLHETDVAHAEAWLFGGTIPTVWLQRHLYHPGTVHWYDAAATLVYTSYFLTTPILAAVLWLRNREVWLRFISRVLALSLAGLITYVVFPEAPPWYAARDHVIAPVSRLSAQGWVYLHAGNLDSLLDGVQRDGANPVAAMPSLHTAFSTLVALFLVSRMTSRWRHLLWLYPAAMGLVLLYTGEHYFLDLIAGVGYAAGVHAVLSRWERSRVVAVPELELAEAHPGRERVPASAPPLAVAVSTQ